jgi:hypothetical protein
LTQSYSSTSKGNKKQRIWTLVSDGKYSPDEIASLVGTTIEYVWKETSMYKKARMGAGLVVNQTTELSKRRAETSMFLQQSDQISRGGTQNSLAPKNQTQMIPTDSFYISGKSDQFLNLPKLESSDLKKLYKEFSAGKKPVDVIANFGYHPEIVESEYNRFSRLSGIDIDSLLKHIIANCNKIMEPQGELKVLIDKYHREGNLKNDDIYQLLLLKSEHEWESKLFIAMGIPIEPFPHDIVPLKCIQCKRPIPGALINSKSEVGPIILHQYTNLQCFHCRNPQIFEQ